MLEQKGFALSKTSGNSMRPLIWGGDHCVVVAPLAGEPVVGDLLMFVQLKEGRERTIVHRLVEVTTRDGHPLYITRGDNCIKEEAVTPGQVIGRVIEVHRVSPFRPWHIIPSRRITTTSTLYRAYTHAWMALWPLRRIFYKVRARLSSSNHPINT